MTAGTLLLDAAARAGMYGLMVRTSGPQIRGGEAAALIRIASERIGSLDDEFDLLLAIDWENIVRFIDEIPMRSDGLVIGDSDEGEAPPAYLATGARAESVPLKAITKSIAGSWKNTVALGVAGAIASLPIEALEEALRSSWKRGEAALAANVQALQTGYERGTAIGALPPLTIPPRNGRRWALSGNEAAGLGALRGGVRFVAAYPITPATEMLEWMAPKLKKLGGALVQAEDELASINMIIGASYGGVPSLTATAGPGLALMTESLGLAITSETPIVVVDVMRGGPSTGIPSKSEQSDLSFAVNGLPGDAPRLVLAPTSISDCAATTQWAVYLAEKLQTAAIVLSDQFLGQSRMISDEIADTGLVAERLVAEADELDYKRYRNTESGVSPMAIPGTRGTVYTADGLEHNEAGIPSSQNADHQRQLDKRERKLTSFDYGPAWADIEGEGEFAIITFGSITNVAREALARAAQQGANARLIALRLLAPALPEQLAAALEGVTRILVVEQNHTGQLYRYLRSAYDLPGKTESFRRPGPLPMRPGELADAIVEWRNQ